MIAPFRFQAPVPLAFGEGGIAALPKSVARLVGADAPVVLVADPFLVENGSAGRALEPLRGAGCEAWLFDDIRSDPLASQIDAIVALAREKGAACIVAMGGGSTMDAAKLAAALATEGEGALAYALGAKRLPKKGLAKVAVSTTAGTGSEVTRTSVYSAGGRKLWGLGPRADVRPGDSRSGAHRRHAAFAHRRDRNRCGRPRHRIGDQPRAQPRLDRDRAGRGARAAPLARPRRARAGEHRGARPCPARRNHGRNRLRRDRSRRRPRGRPRSGRMRRRASRPRRGPCAQRHHGRHRRLRSGRLCGGGRGSGRADRRPDGSGSGGARAARLRGLAARDRPAPRSGRPRGFRPPMQHRSPNSAALRRTRRFSPPTAAISRPERLEAAVARMLAAA